MNSPSASMPILASEERLSEGGRRFSRRWSVYARKGALLGRIGLGKRLDEAADGVADQAILRQTVDWMASALVLSNRNLGKSERRNLC